MKRVIGIDPGTVKHGWCLLDFTIRSSPIWVQGGHSEDPCMLLETYAPDPDLLVVVEQPRALHNPLANVQVIATAWEGGDVFGFARALGFSRLKVGPQEWRNALVGRPRPGDNVDHKVEAELRRIVRQMPSRTSAHARDAAGVAITGARMWLSGHYGAVRPPNLSSKIEHGVVLTMSPAQRRERT